MPSLPHKLASHYALLPDAEVIALAASQPGLLDDAAALCAIEERLARVEEELREEWDAEHCGDRFE